MSKRSNQPKPPRGKVDPSGMRATIGGPPAWAAALLLAISIGIVYGPVLNAPFIFDDADTITGNESITTILPLIGTQAKPGPLNPPPNLPTSARPLVNLSFAINYKFSERNPAGYHATNAAIHFLSSLLLWAIVRRTLRLHYFAGRFDAVAGWLALAVAIIWALHPLQTETVIYATQRTELMMAFFYLATLYCSLRYWASDGLASPRATWLVLAFLACLAGMASKEVMVSAPLIVLLFDRSFISGSLPAALRKSWPLYIALAATWILLLFLSIGSPHGAAAGFNLGPPIYVWWFTQAKIFWLYLKLTIWPSPLMIHYELPYVTTVPEACLYVVPLILLGLGTLVLLWRNSPIGFLGTCLFAILSPTFVVPVITEMAAERRMYLPLAALVVLLVVVGYSLIQSRLPSAAGAQRATFGTRSQYVVLLAGLLLAVLLGFASTHRLAAYQDETELWQQVVAHQSHNHIAYNNLGHLFIKGGRLPEAIESLQSALALKPDYIDALNELGLAYLNSGRLPEAVDKFQATIAIKPDFLPAFNNLGLTFAAMGEFPESVETFRRAIKLAPKATGTYVNLGNVLTNAGRPEEAIEALQEAAAIKDDDPNVLYNLGIAWMQMGRFPEAIDYFERALKVKPDFANAYINLGIALHGSGNNSQAIEQFKKALQLDPKQAIAHRNLGLLFTDAGNWEESIAHLKEALRLQPNLIEVHQELGEVFRRAGNYDQAVREYKEMVKLRPNDPLPYISLAKMLAQTDHVDESLSTAEKGVEIARSTKQPAIAEQIEEWLKHYRTELRRSEGATLNRNSGSTNQ